MILSSKKANILAVIFVVLLLLVGISIITYKGFIPKEDFLDYTKIVSETHNMLERTFYSSTASLYEQGLSNMSDVWYCNAPYPPDYSEIEDSYNYFISSQFDNIQWDSAGEGYKINITPPKLTLDLSDINNPHANISSLVLTITSKDETRVINFSEGTLMLDDSLTEFVPPILKWMECNAGFLSQKFAQFNDNKPCRLAGCCCGQPEYVDTILDQLHSEGDIYSDDVKDIINSSLSVLNNLFGGATSCTDTGSYTSNITCSVDYGNSILHIENTPFIDYYKTDCELLCSFSTEKGGTLVDWSDETNTLPETCPTHRARLDVETGISPDMGDLLDKTEQLRNDQDLNGKVLFYLAALHRKTAGNLRIVCTDKNKPYTNPFVFRVQFRLKYHCTYPPIPSTLAPDDMLCGPPLPPLPLPCETPGEECKYQGCRVWYCDENLACTIQGPIDAAVGRACGKYEECGATCDENGNCVGGSGRPCHASACDGTLYPGVCSDDGSKCNAHIPAMKCCSGVRCPDVSYICCDGVCMNPGLTCSGKVN